MTTNNAVNVGLSGATGTGNFVGANTPTLITPILGVAAATSINFGGTALSAYAVGSWTPIDTSGASLTLTTSAGYTKIGNIVFAYALITYPVTVDGSANQIGGFPFASANAAYAKQGLLTVSTSATAKAFAMNQAATTGLFLSSTGAGQTNAQMSATDNYIVAIYPVA